MSAGVVCAVLLTQAAAAVRAGPATPALVDVDASLLPIAYLGSGAEGDFGKLCTFQVVAVIDSPCWSRRGTPPPPGLCSNNTNEEGRIIATSSWLKNQCPAVSTQMYLNSLMDFSWYANPLALRAARNRTHTHTPLARAEACADGL